MRCWTGTEATDSPDKAIFSSEPMRLAHARNPSILGRRTSYPIAPAGLSTGDFSSSSVTGVFGTAAGLVCLMRRQMFR